MAESIPIIPPDAARFLETLLLITAPGKILEIGCAVGFSACLCAVTLPRARITTIDRYEIMLDAARENFQKMGVSDRVTLLEGEAVGVLEIMCASPAPPVYDFIFMDAGKAQYINMIPLCARLCRAGGVILADDCFQGGDIFKARGEVPRRRRTTHSRMRAFLAYINGNGLKSTLLPIGDGLALIYKEGTL
jgi:predicted O-methyltransferase YrrM